VHPTLAGKSTENIADKNGTYVYKTLVDQAKRNGETTLEYYWDNPNTKVNELKHTYAMFFEPYGWTIASGMYMSDIEKIVDEHIRGLAFFIFLIAGIVVVADVILLFFIMRLYRKEAQSVAEGIEKISSGDFTVKLEVKNLDEFGMIAQDINKMVQSLRQTVSSVVNSSQMVDNSSSNLAAMAQQLQSASESIGSTFERIVLILRTSLHRLKKLHRVLKKWPLPLRLSQGHLKSYLQRQSRLLRLLTKRSQRGWRCCKSS